MKKFVWFLSIFFSVVLMAQKKDLRLKDYDQWQKLVMGEISPKGDLFSYYLYSANKSDTLFIKGLKNGVSNRILINAYEAKFLKYKSLFIYKDSLGNLNLENSKKLLLHSFKNVKHFQSVAEGRYLILYTQETSLFSGNLDVVILFDTGKLKELRFENTVEVSLSDDQNFLAVSLKSDRSGRLGIYDLTNWQEILSKTWKGMEVQRIHWGKNNSSLVFLKANLNEKLLPISVGFIENINKGDIKYVPDTGSRGKVSLSSQEYPYLSNDGKKILFKIEFPPEKNVEDSIVEIWNSKDRYLFPAQKYHRPYSSEYKVVYYNLETEKMKSIGISTEGKVSVGPNQKYALITSNFQFTPSFKFKGEFSNVYIYDFEKDTTSFFLQRYDEGLVNDIQFSPSGKQLLYVKDADWWIYNLDTKGEINLTGEIGTQFFYYPYPNLITAYKKPGWSNDGKLVLVGDESDLWLIKSDGSKKKKISAKSGISLRLDHQHHKFNNKNSPNIFNPYTGIYLEAVDPKTDERGYYLYTFKNGLIQIVFKSMHFSKLQADSKNKKFIFEQENFSTPPEVVYKNIATNQEVIVARSNKQQDNYYWGKSEMIYYHSKTGENLRAALHYPARYDKNKKYPLIFFIYMDRTSYLNKYYNPDMYSGDFNPAVFSLNGYFVLQPQITYDISDPGVSANEDINAALDYLEKQKMIDMKHIGLYGHSFGGYEASFIATQSNRFATIVAGSPWTDLVSSYFDFVPFLQQPDFLRLEYQQHRMKRSFFEAKEQYLANSPVFQADKIETPLLIWVGKKDPNISWFQGRELFLALTRQQKACTMLAYPAGYHNLLNKEDRYDLNSRLLEWFGYYLKGHSISSWMQ